MCHFQLSAGPYDVEEGEDEHQRSGKACAS